MDALFTSYLRRPGFAEPLAASFCNGTTSTCAGLSQWGSQELAQQGYGPMEILRYYYGDDIELVENAPVQSLGQSYPGYPLRLGSTGPDVMTMKTMLNRISRDYPAIPKVQPVDGIFGASTEQSVIKFQQIFSLTPDESLETPPGISWSFCTWASGIGGAGQRGSDLLHHLGARQPPRYHFPRRHRRKCQGNTVPSLCGGGVL